MEKECNTIFHVTGSDSWAAGAKIAISHEPQAIPARKKLDKCRGGEAK
jgi:hypothetical protein